jgi:hypothetical protein
MRQLIGTFPVGSVRFSLGPFSTLAEVDASLSAVKALAQEAQQRTVSTQ